MNMLWERAVAAGVITFVSAYANAESSSPEPRAQGVEVVLASEAHWTYLNPARGDKAPMAATLWGDRSGNGATGFLLKPKDGFESPPHIHNVTYRGMVIRGLIHNDDPDAAAMWMPAGSFWTQPKGEVHITAAKGDTLAYIEIGEGPYLVQPAEDAFDSGERPVNVDQKNLVWLDASELVWMDQGAGPDDAGGPKVAFLWGSREAGQLNATLLKLPAGYSGAIESNNAPLRAVVIQGNPQYDLSKDSQALEPGSYFGSEQAATHTLKAAAHEETILYVRTRGVYELLPSK